MTFRPRPELGSAELLGALSRHSVRFVIVGGTAALLHGARRPTRDLDICPDLTSQNMERLSVALDRLSARLRLRPELGEIEIRPNPRLLAELPTTHWRTCAGDIDILYAIAAGRDGEPVEFPALHRRGVVVRVRNADVVIAALEDVVASKAHANRPKDRLALTELRRLMALQRVGRDMSGRGAVAPSRDPRGRVPLSALRASEPSLSEASASPSRPTH